MFVRNYELAARRCSAITLGRPTAGSTSIGASSGAEKTQRHCCTICCTFPNSGGWLAGSLAIFSTHRGDVSADQQWEGLRILANSAQVADRKTVALRSRRLRKC